MKFVRTGYIIPQLAKFHSLAFLHYNILGSDLVGGGAPSVHYRGWNIEDIPNLETGVRLYSLSNTKPSNPHIVHGRHLTSCGKVL